MDNSNNPHYDPRHFQDQTQTGGPDDMSGIEMSSAPATQFYGQDNHRGSSNSGQSQGHGGGTAPMGSAGTQQAGPGVDPQSQNMSHFGNMFMGGGMNSAHFAPAAAMGYNPMMAAPNMFSGQQYANSHLMSQMMLNNAANIAYANALANVQSMQTPIQPQMQPNPQFVNAMNQGFMPNMPGAPDFSDPNVQAMMRKSFAGMPILPQSQMTPGMMMAPMFQQMQQPVQAVDQRRNSTHTDHSMNSGQQFNNNSAGQRQNMASGMSQTAGPQLDPTQSYSYHDTITQSRRGSTAETQHQALRRYSAQQVQHMQSKLPEQAKLDGQSSPTLQEPIKKEHTPNQTSLSSQGPPSRKASNDIYKDAYSSTGFDMLSVLMRVATRKNPEIEIGAVDLSCAFVVSDVQEHDIPIVYVSESFERLTGYTKHEILGRNCRFLQSPEGHVQPGHKRKDVDDDTVLHLKNVITARREAQISIINYRKGGQPFMNLLTVIPVTFQDSPAIQFYVGFQVDLVEQPHSVTNKNADGSYQINYQRGLTMPRYIFTGKGDKVSAVNAGHTISRDEVSTVLGDMSTNDSHHSQRVWDKVLLENADDVIFVLSLKGLFLYLSPSTSKILEYSCDELIGTSLSSVCHPSDIVPVTRELKDTTSDATVTVVFRVRRKTNGYMWFEGHGSVYTEQGKGRKSIVLVGRERPVYTLKKRDIMANGGFGENEVWTKLSTSGMFLYVSSSIRSLLDKHPDELVGTSIQSLMRPDSRGEFGRILEIARSGRRASTRHELLNRRGQVLQAFSTVHPGDAAEGSKPTFLVGQTKLLKYARPSGSKQPPKSVPPNEGTESVDTVVPETAVAVVASPSPFVTTFERIPTHAGHESLPIGDQSAALAHELNLFDELKTTRSTSWQFELRQMEKRNRLLAEELQGLLAARKKRKRRKGAGANEKECSNCHTKATPEWRRGPSGSRDLCNSCGLRWAKQQGRISPRTSSHRSTKSTHSDKTTGSDPKQQNSGGGGAAAGGGGGGGSSDTRSNDEASVPGAQEQVTDEYHVTKAARVENRESGASPTKMELAP